MRSYGPGNPLVFSHIPKSAGTSLGAALEQVLQPQVSVPGGIDTALFGGYDDLENISPIFRAGIYLTPEDMPADAELVTAHVAPGTTTARYPGADHISVLAALKRNFLFIVFSRHVGLAHAGRAAARCVPRALR